MYLDLWNWTVTTSILRHLCVGYRTCLMWNDLLWLVHTSNMTAQWVLSINSYRKWNNVVLYVVSEATLWRNLHFHQRHLHRKHKFHVWETKLIMSWQCYVLKSCILLYVCTWFYHLTEVTCAETSDGGSEWLTEGTLTLLPDTVPQNEFGAVIMRLKSYIMLPSDVIN